METKSSRLFGIEMLGTFALVYFSAGLICVNQMTTPAGAGATSALTPHQPGLFGVALGQGLILAALLALTAPVTGGYLNPAIALTLWVFGKIETPRATTLIAAQFAGSVLAALCLQFTFDAALLRSAHFGAPHVNPLAYPAAGQATLLTGSMIELLLTFFLVMAIFGLAGKEALHLGIVAGMIATGCALLGAGLTGAALNPARWLGPTALEAYHTTRAAWNDSLIYIAGPVLGALLGGFFVFKVYLPQEKK